MYFVEKKYILPIITKVFTIFEYPKFSMIMMFETPINRFCAIFGHNFTLVSKIDEDTSELVCKCCNNHFISTDSGNIMNLSAFGETNSFSNYFKSKRRANLINHIGYEL